MKTETNTTVKFNSPIPYKPDNDFEDMRQRDTAAEMARQWARRTYPEAFVNVVSINRGRTNLVVQVSLTRWEDL